MLYLSVRLGFSSADRFAKNYTQLSLGQACNRRSRSTGRIFRGHAPAATALDPRCDPENGLTGNDDSDAFSDRDGSVDGPAGLQFRQTPLEVREVTPGRASACQ